MSKVAVLLAPYFEDVEYEKPVEALKEEGHIITVISKQQDEELKGKQGKVTATADSSIDNASPCDFDALLIPGGFSPDQLRADERYVDFARHFVYKEKPVLMICHGPQLLITAEVLRGRNVTGYKSIQTDLKYAGANVFDEEVVVDRNFVSSRNPADIPAFIEESKKLLQEKG
ncbi:type 1 glutamine amidotransferase domain-containing protein [Bacillus marinisedimentorum]|uniref:type 1 glutamine amidotransferase domain-containing protein n=1 Tax=Bacillus marinisedimentorum TaxID=1821260 RepID=UPI000871D8EA|nr:type 1 glutamine amidotransferase domain-containing protein [Bacillus marinisedimentorum]